MRLKVHVEADAALLEYREAVIYLTAAKPVSGAEVEVELREGVAITGCWPRWPDRMEERVAAWRVETYPRDFEERVLHSFGLRLDLAGAFKPTAHILRWELRERVVELSAERGGGLRAIVGPLAPGFRLIEWRGRLARLESLAHSYVTLKGESIRLLLELGDQLLVSGRVEYVPNSREAPFEVKLKGVRAGEREETLSLRLDDLALTA